MSLPKVLIIGQPFNNDTGGGITLSNLFKGWDRDKLAVACSAYLLNDNINREVCDTYYQLGENEHKFSFPFNYLQRRYKSGLLKFNEEKNQNSTITKSKFRISFIKRIFYPFVNYIGLFNLINKINLSVEFCNWVDIYNPEIIYAQTSHRHGILFCLAVQTYLNKPLVFHMMDDWPSTINQKGLFRKYWQRKTDHEFRVLLNRATILMSISEKMAEEYKKRYNKDFITFHNPIDIDFWKKNQRKNYELNKEPSILYAGRVGLGIDSSLEIFAKAIEQINKEFNLSIKFILQTQEKPQWTRKYKHVIHNSFVSYNDLPRVFSSSDFLLLPYDFTPESIKFIRYSMPTKVPEYMMTGTPIIIFAPKITAIVKYAKENAWAKVITENNIEDIVIALKQMIEDKELRQFLSTNAKTLAEKNHNSVDVKNRFKTIICSAITNKT